jgi:hypothetical protein
LLGGLGLPLVPWANWGLAAILVLLGLTIVNRVRRGLGTGSQGADPTA